MGVTGNFEVGVGLEGSGVRGGGRGSGERVVSARARLRKKKHTPHQTKEDTEQENPPGKTQPDSHTMSTKDSRERNKLWPWRSIWKMRTTECSSNC